MWHFTQNDQIGDRLSQFPFIAITSKRCTISYLTFIYVSK